MNTKFLFFLVLVCTFSFAVAQPTAGLVSYLDFENCEVVDRTGNNTSIIAGLPGMCDCGIRTSAFEFDGMNQFISFQPDANINQLFTRATFAISFYFRPLVNTGYMTLFSKRESCVAQAGFDMYYNAQNREIVTELSENPTSRLRLTSPIPADRCWNHVLIIRSGTNVRIFINGAQTNNQSTPSVINLVNTRPLEIGTGACVGVNSQPYNGLISDLRFYNRDIQPLELAQLFLNPDRINNRDTTIFLGQEVVINAGPTCSQNINWTPNTAISDPSIPNPVLNPSETTTYTAALNYGNCIARMGLTVTVIDPASLDCRQLPMANAFTPNNDGLNDRFGISNPFTLEALRTFEVYDRNGTPVFITDSPFDTWDGTFRGSLMPPGAYMYVVKYSCRGEDLVKSGTFHLIR